MIIEHTVSSKNKIEIDIPPEYVNRELEITIFPIRKEDRKKTGGTKKTNIRSLHGILRDGKYSPRKKKKAWEMV